MLEANKIRDLLIEARARYGNQPFLIDDDKLGTVSYSDLLKFSQGIAAQFDSLGIPVGAPVATIFHNCGMAALLFLAVMSSRRLLVPLNPISTPNELTYMLDKAQCTAVLVDPSHTLSNEYGDRLSVLVTDHERYFAERRHAGVDRGVEVIDNALEKIFVGEIVFTSGSTGRPKGVVLSEASLISNARALARVYDLRSTDRFLTVCPLFHNSGQVFTTLSCLLAGGSTVAIRSAAGMLHFWSYLDKFRANWSFGMVSFLALLLSRSEGPTAEGQLRGLLTGGSAIDAEAIQRFEARFGVPVRTVYGLTETASISTCEYLDPAPRSYGSSGRPLPICNIRIGTGPEAQGASHSHGEILISGENVFECYIGEPDMTRTRKVDGWVHTGDVGYFDESGNLFVVDRLDSMLIVGGENVYPAEVERLCSSLPGAAQIVLVGIDHKIWGKELVLVYRPVSGILPSISSWRRVLEKEVAVVKVPQRYVSIHELGLEDFPRKDNGKLDRQAITTLVAKVAPSTPRR